MVWQQHGGWQRNNAASRWRHVSNMTAASMAIIEAENGGEANNGDSVASMKLAAMTAKRSHQRNGGVISSNVAKPK